MRDRLPGSPCLVSYQCLLPSVRLFRVHPFKSQDHRSRAWDILAVYHTSCAQRQQNATLLGLLPELYPAQAACYPWRCCLKLSPCVFKIGISSGPLQNPPQIARTTSVRQDSWCGPRTYTRYRGKNSCRWVSFLTKYRGKYIAKCSPMFGCG